MIKALCILVSLSCTVYLLNAYEAAPMRKPDLVLSSGFLAFARHAGVIKAMENANVEVANIVGTSSGSLAGAFYAAGYNADRISDELSKQKPIELIRPGKRINRGAFSLRALERHLATLLPKDFKDLEKPLAVGVYETDAADRKFELITDGDLPAAVAASCAIPYVFQPIKTGNPPRYLADGGFADRFGLDEWYTWAESLDKAIGAERRAIVHAVGTSRKKKDPYGESMNTESVSIGVEIDTRGYYNNLFASRGKVDDPAAKGELTKNDVINSPPKSSAFVVRTKAADASFFSLKDFDNQREEALRSTSERLGSFEFAEFMQPSIDAGQQGSL